MSSRVATACERLVSACASSRVGFCDFEKKLRNQENFENGRIAKAWVGAIAKWLNAVPLGGISSDSSVRIRLASLTLLRLLFYGGLAQMVERGISCVKVGRSILPISWRPNGRRPEISR